MEIIDEMIADGLAQIEVHRKCIEAIQRDIEKLREAKDEMYEMQEVKADRPVL